MKTKFLILTILLLSKCVVSFAQEGYLITGKIPGVNSGTVMFRALEDGAKRDSAEIKNGMFSFKGGVDHPKQFLMFRKGINQRPFIFFLENAPITLDVDSDDMQKTKVTGSVSQKDYEKYSKELAPIDAKLLILSKLQRDYAKTDKRLNDSVMDEQEKCYQMERDIAKSFILKQPNSIVSAYLTLLWFCQRPDSKEVEMLYKTLPPAMRQTRYGKEIAKSLARAQAHDVGTIAPNFIQPDTTGKLVSLKDFKGKYVLLDFWASWCVPCRRENHHIIPLWGKYKSKNFQIVSISIDEMSTRNAWLKAIKDDKLTWIQLSDLKKTNEARQQYGVTNVPVNFLIDPQGKIIAKNVFGDNMIKLLADVFNSTKINK